MRESLVFERAPRQEKAPGCIKLSLAPYPLKMVDKEGKLSFNIQNINFPASTTKLSEDAEREQRRCHW
jgi:hypothetical protein